MSKRKPVVEINTDEIGKYKYTAWGEEITNIKSRSIYLASDSLNNLKQEVRSRRIPWAWITEGSAGFGDYDERYVPRR